MLECREVKEKYFSKDNEDDWIKEPVTSNIQRLDKDLLFEVELYKEDMVGILNLPISELGNKSWIQSFNDELVKCKSSPDYQVPKLILLTGGASRMEFISSTCRKVFPPETKIRVGSEPSLTIARGLAYAGRIDFKVESFMREVIKFTASNGLRDKINKKFEELSTDLSQTTFDIFSEVIKSSLKRWSEGEIKLISDLENDTRKNVDDRLKSKDCLETFEQLMENWLKNLSLDIQRDTREICVKYGITESTFKLELTEYSVADSNMSQYFKSEDMIERKLLTTGSGIVGVVLGSTVTTFLYASFITGGFVSIILGGVSGLAACGLLKIDPLAKMSTDVIRNNEIPKLLRLLDNQQIDEMIDKGRTEFENDLINQFKKQSETNLHKLIEAIEKDLLECADKARILIK